MFTAIFRPTCSEFTFSRLFWQNIIQECDKLTPDGRKVPTRGRGMSKKDWLTRMVSCAFGFS